MPGCLRSRQRLRLARRPASPLRLPGRQCTDCAGCRPTAASARPGARKALLGQRQGRVHPGHTAADDQRRSSAPAPRLRVQRLQQPRSAPPPCAPDPWPCAWRRRGRRSEPTSTGCGCWPSRTGTGFSPAARMLSWNSGSCVRGVHEATTTRLSSCSLICSVICLMRVLRAGVQIVLGVDDAGQAGRVLGDAGHIQVRRRC